MYDETHNTLNHITSTQTCWPHTCIQNNTALTLPLKSAPADSMVGGMVMMTKATQEGVVTTAKHLVKTSLSATTLSRFMDYARYIYTE